MDSIKIVKKSEDYDLYLTFFSKKVEKIISALYLITESFSQEESLKWQLRDKGLKLLSRTMSLNKADLAYREKLLSDLRWILLEMLSFLEVSLTANLITEMNVEIFRRELELLLKIINDSSTGIGRRNLVSLRGDFFKVKGGFLRENEMSFSEKKSDKGQTKGQVRVSFKSTIGEIKKPQIKNNLVKKQTRQEQILKLFDKGHKLTIKDISQVIDNCGEKTIQRELQTLMKTGVIQKEGERRWSHYSLIPH